MSKHNPKTPPRSRPRVRSSLSAAAVVVWSVLWVVVGGCAKKSGQETLDTLSIEMVLVEGGDVYDGVYERTRGRL